MIYNTRDMETFEISSNKVSPLPPPRKKKLALRPVLSLNYFSVTIGSGDMDSGQFYDFSAHFWPNQLVLNTAVISEFAKIGRSPPFLD